MEQFIVILVQRGEVSFYRDGDGGVYERSIERATRFNGYHAATAHMANVLHPSNGGLSEPVAIVILPAASEVIISTVESVGATSRRPNPRTT